MKGRDLLILAAVLLVIGLAVADSLRSDESRVESRPTTSGPEAPPSTTTAPVEEDVLGRESFPPVHGSAGRDRPRADRLLRRPRVRPADGARAPERRRALDVRALGRSRDRQRRGRHRRAGRRRRALPLRRPQSAQPGPGELRGGLRLPRLERRRPAGGVVQPQARGHRPGGGEFAAAAAGLPGGLHAGRRGRLRAGGSARHRGTGAAPGLRGDHARPLRKRRLGGNRRRGTSDRALRGRQARRRPRSLRPLPGATAGALAGQLLGRLPRRQPHPHPRRGLLGLRRRGASRARGHMVTRRRLARRRRARPGHVRQPPDRRTVEWPIGAVQLAWRRG